jgi:hypothetical protein
MRNLLRKASLVALLVGVNLVVGARESTGEQVPLIQHCQWMRAGWGCYEGCRTWYLTNCGQEPCFEGSGCPE